MAKSYLALRGCLFPGRYGRACSAIIVRTAAKCQRERIKGSWGVEMSKANRPPRPALGGFLMGRCYFAVSFMPGKALNNGSGRITLLTNPCLRNGFTAEVALGNLSGSTPTRLRRSIILDGVTKRPPYSEAAPFQDFDMLYVCLPPEKPQRLVARSFYFPIS